MRASPLILAHHCQWHGYGHGCIIVCTAYADHCRGAFCWCYQVALAWCSEHTSLSVTRLHSPSLFSLFVCVYICMIHTYTCIYHIYVWMYIYIYIWYLCIYHDIYIVCIYIYDIYLWVWWTWCGEDDEGVPRCGWSRQPTPSTSYPVSLYGVPLPPPFDSGSPHAHALMLARAVMHFTSITTGMMCGRRVTCLIMFIRFI